MRLILLLAGMCAGAGVSGAEPAKPKTHTVTIEGMRFTPENVTVALGDAIVWINKDVVAHTATSAPGRFDSKVIPPEKSWRHRPAKKGRFEYVCSYHPTMVGSVRVK